MSEVSKTQLETAIKNTCVQFQLPLVQASLAELKADIEITALNQGAGLLTLKISLPFACAQFLQEFTHKLVQTLQDAFPELCEIDIHWQSKIAAHKANNGVKACNGIKNIIAVASGKGGVGKSSTSVNVALALKALGAKVGLLDADIYGPNLALMLGVPADVRPQVEAQKYLLPLQAQGIQSMSMSYVTTADTPLVWRGPKASGAFTQLLGTTLWHELDYLLIDMPPGTGDIQLTLGQTVPVNGVLIVTTPQNMATQDAQKGIAMFRKVSVPVLGVIENMSTHICSNCGHEEAIFGEGGGSLLSQKFEVPFLGAVPLDARIREDCDNGMPTVASAPESDIARRYLEIALCLGANLVKNSETLTNPAIKLVEN